MKARVLALASAATALVALAALPPAPPSSKAPPPPISPPRPTWPARSSTSTSTKPSRRGRWCCTSSGRLHAGCQIEAHLFAEASDEFKAQHATVIGVTAGKTDQLEKFSTDTQYCSGKFAMAADTDLKIATSYKSTWPSVRCRTAPPT